MCMFVPTVGLWVALSLPALYHALVWVGGGERVGWGGLVRAVCLGESLFGRFGEDRPAEIPGSQMTDKPRS